MPRMGVHTTTAVAIILVVVVSMVSGCFGGRPSSDVGDGHDERSESMPDPSAALIPQEVRVDWYLTDPMNCISTNFPEELEGITYALFEIDPATIGQQYRVSALAMIPGFAFLDEWRHDVRASTLSNQTGQGSIPTRSAYGAFYSCHGAGVISGSYLTGPALETSADQPPTAQEVSGEWIMSSMTHGCLYTQGAQFPEDLDGVTYASFAIEPSTIGQTFHAEIQVADYNQGPGFAFLDTNRVAILSKTTTTIDGDAVPAGAAWGVFWSCFGGAMQGMYATPAA